jgi:hypothetical protein
LYDSCKWKTIWRSSGVLTMRAFSQLLDVCTFTLKIFLWAELCLFSYYLLRSFYCWVFSPLLLFVFSSWLVTTMGFLEMVGFSTGDSSWWFFPITANTKQVVKCYEYHHRVPEQRVGFWVTCMA